MITTVKLVSLGVVVAVVLGNVTEEDVAAFRASWSRCLADPAAEPQVTITASIGTEHSTGPNDLSASSVAELMDRLTARVTISAIEVRRFDLLMLHAGAVSSPDGSAVGYIGPSGRGKTTASIALGRSFGYVTDETLAISDDLSIVRYPKPLSVKQPPPEVWKRQEGPDELGLITPVADNLRLVGLVLLDRTDDHPMDAPPQVTPVSLVEAINELIPQVSYLPERGAPLHRLRDVIEACGGLLRVTYRESDTLAPVIAQLMTRPVGSPIEEAGPPATESVAPGELARAQVTDAIDDDAALIVLANGTVRVLDGIAPTIWHALPGTSEQVTAAVVAAHGAPPEGDPGEMVDAAVAELVEAGLVVRGEQHG